MIRKGRLPALSVLVGAAAGTGAILFYLATILAVRVFLGGGAGYFPEPRPAGEPLLAWPPLPPREFAPWLLLLLPTLGGLLCGLLTWKLAPETAGAGTDAVIKAYHEQGGDVRARVPLVKTLVTALSIGSGGSGGREGPVTQIGAGIGSTIAALFRLGPDERRILMAAGVGAAVAALFHAPVAGALFAAEVLYASAEFEPEVLVPAALASAAGYGVAGLALGWTPIFTLPPVAFTDPLQLGPYLILAVAMALLSAVFTRGFHAGAAAFGRLRMPAPLKPALGAFLTGAVGLALYFASGKRPESLSVLSFGHDVLQRMMSGADIGAGLLLTVSLGKILTTVLTVGSGGSGGLFGAALVIGGCGGGALGVILHRAWPTLAPHPSAFVVLGMGGFFSAASKTPFSTLMIVCELTGGYGLLAPALWVCGLSFLFSDRMSLFPSQPERRADSLLHRTR